MSFLPPWQKDSATQPSDRFNMVNRSSDFAGIGDDVNVTRCRVQCTGMYTPNRYCRFECELGAGPEGSRCACVVDTDMVIGLVAGGTGFVMMIAAVLIAYCLYRRRIRMEWKLAHPAPIIAEGYPADRVVVRSNPDEADDVLLRSTGVELPFSYLFMYREATGGGSSSAASFTDPRNSGPVSANNRINGGGTSDFSFRGFSGSNNAQTATASGTPAAIAPSVTAPRSPLSVLSAIFGSFGRRTPASRENSQPAATTPNVANTNASTTVIAVAGRSPDSVDEGLSVVVAPVGDTLTVNVSEVEGGETIAGAPSEHEMARASASTRNVSADGSTAAPEDTPDAAVTTATTTVPTPPTPIPSVRRSIRPPPPDVGLVVAYIDPSLKGCFHDHEPNPSFALNMAVSYTDHSPTATSSEEEEGEGGRLGCSRRALSGEANSCVNLSFPQKRRGPNGKKRFADGLASTAAIAATLLKRGISVASFGSFGGGESPTKERGSGNAGRALPSAAVEGDACVITSKTNDTSAFVDIIGDAANEHDNAGNDEGINNRITNNANVVMSSVSNSGLTAINMVDMMHHGGDAQIMATSTILMAADSPPITPPVAMYVNSIRSNSDNKSFSREMAGASPSTSNNNFTPATANGHPTLGVSPGDAVPTFSLGGGSFGVAECTGANEAPNKGTIKSAIATTRYTNPLDAVFLATSPSATTMLKAKAEVDRGVRLDDDDGISRGLGAAAALPSGFSPQTSHAPTPRARFD